MPRRQRQDGEVTPDTYDLETTGTIVISPNRPVVTSSVISSLGRRIDDGSIRYESYIHYTQMYIRSLDNDHSDHNFDSRWNQQEDMIESEMISLDFFEGIRDAFRGCHLVRVNGQYDYTNLTHRFILRYVSRHGAIVDHINYLIEQRPQASQCHSIPRNVFVLDDLRFLQAVETNERIAPSNPPSITYLIHEDRLRLQSTSTPIDFVVNGQKLKLYLQCMIDNESRSQYASVITVRVTSERGTNTRSILQLACYNRELSFTRLPTNRPIHGFKFVRRDGGRLVVKEIH